MTTDCRVDQLRGLPYPSVAMPVSWNEVMAVATGAAGAEPLFFLVTDVAARVEQLGDLLAEAATLEQALPPLGASG